MLVTCGVGCAVHTALAGPLEVAVWQGGGGVSWLFPFGK